MAYALRARFAKDILCEFYPPKKDTGKVVIFCGGMPMAPTPSKLFWELHKKNYWVFSMRYRGTWESDGEFLKESPEQDVLDVINGLSKGFTSLWDQKKYCVQPKEIFIFGSSFGGPAAILASRDPRVKKGICFSPVVDWTARSKAEPLDKLERIVRQAFGNGYRFSSKNWKKLSSGKFYNPMHHASEIDGTKLLLIHAKDDDVVPYSSVARFAKKTGARLITLPRGGHIGSSHFVTKSWLARLQKFMRS